MFSTTFSPKTGKVASFCAYFLSTLLVLSSLLSTGIPAGAQAQSTQPSAGSQQNPNQQEAPPEAGGPNSDNGPYAIPKKGEERPPPAPPPKPKKSERMADCHIPVS